MSLLSLPTMDLPLPPSTAVGASNPIRSWSPSASTGSQSGKAFSNILDGALGEVSRLQNDVTQAQTRFQVGAPGASLEETMVSMQKAQLAFTSALTVRNRLVSAYTDIMNMAL